MSREDGENFFKDSLEELDQQIEHLELSYLSRTKKTVNFIQIRETLSKDSLIIVKKLKVCLQKCNKSTLQNGCSPCHRLVRRSAALCHKIGRNNWQERQLNRCQEKSSLLPVAKWKREKWASNKL